MFGARHDTTIQFDGQELRLQPEFTEQCGHAGPFRNGAFTVVHQNSREWPIHKRHQKQETRHPAMPGRSNVTLSNQCDIVPKPNDYHAPSTFSAVTPRDFIAPLRVEIALNNAWSIFFDTLCVEPSASANTQISP